MEILSLRGTEMIHLSFDRGTILIRGEQGTPYGRWDPRVNAFRAQAIHYRDILYYLDHDHVPYVDDVMRVVDLTDLRPDIELKDYQQDALRAWLAADRRGVIELPTGAGKTYIALQAIATVARSTLVVVPTLDLVDQWRQRLREHLGTEAGVITGNEYDVRPVTVTTYDSATIRAEQLGNRFMLLVFDEVHHLPAPSYMQIAEMYAAPYRLGLTATYSREDGAHEELPRLVGVCVYRQAVSALAGRELSPYTHQRVLVDLRPDEREEYETNYNTFKRYLASTNFRLRDPADFQRLVMLSGRDPAARDALLARNRALNIALCSESKIDILGALLRAHPHDKTIVFTRHNRLVYAISRRYLIPSVTHLTPKDERKSVLDKFRSGEYRVIVTGQVLDEGIDVPDATVAIIVSGTGSRREYIQRLGRILRKRSGKHAYLYEIVSKNTVELQMSTRRRR